MADLPKRQSPDCPLVPCGERVVLVLDARKTKHGSIYIPDSAQDAPQFATVMAVSDDVIEPFEVGDRVIFGKYSGNSITIDDQEYLMLNADEVLARYIKK